MIILDGWRAAGWLKVFLSEWRCAGLPICGDAGSGGRGAYHLRRRPI